MRVMLVLPTRVGMVRRPCLLPIRGSCSPHTRGDGPVIDLIKTHSVAFSPHAWGWSVVMRPVGELEPVLPTRVGMVRQPAS